MEHVNSVKTIVICGFIPEFIEMMSSVPNPFGCALRTDVGPPFSLVSFLLLYVLSCPEEESSSFFTHLNEFFQVETVQIGLRLYLWMSDLPDESFDSTSRPLTSTSSVGHTDNGKYFTLKPKELAIVVMETKTDEVRHCKFRERSVGRLFSSPNAKKNKE
ncbi:hypothetical protein RUM44_009354 [Polyplax serrata]|uniref:Uncharacterized protein n=1 Tax=Polyplax serrata TaxID=468196 RepID=A0ABR1ASG1_POLSC